MPYLSTRSAMVLVPEQAMLDWVREVSGEDLDLDSLMEEAEVYLVPSFEEDDEFEAVLQEQWPALFETELKAWCGDPARWPQDRSLALFLDWFQVTPFNGVHDLGTDALDVEAD